MFLPCFGSDVHFNTFLVGARKKRKQNKKKKLSSVFRLKNLIWYAIAFLKILLKL